MESKETIKVLTLNCWGVFYVAKRIKQRLEAIRRALTESDYDIVCLQEIWTEKDYTDFQIALKDVFPYENYFHSNFVGSGCCLFSKFPILDTFFYRFSMNGYAHSLFHGDWFGGKGVGMVKIKTAKGFLLNVYLTHLHGVYNEFDKVDTYLAHRVSQTLEMMQFISLTSNDCDASLLLGDMNAEADSSTYRLITQFGAMQDCLLSQAKPPQEPEKTHTTCARADNEFTTANEVRGRPYGQRLDYIFFNHCSGTRVSCLDCDLAMTKIPGTNHNYSDHEGVQASIVLERAINGGPSYEVDSKSSSVFEETQDILTKGLQANQYIRRVCLFVLCGVVALLMACIIYLVEGGSSRLTNLLMALLGSIFFGLLWHTLIVCQAETKAFVNNLQNLKWIIMRNRQRV